MPHDIAMSVIRAKPKIAVVFGIPSLYDAGHFASTARKGEGPGCELAFMAGVGLYRQRIVVHRARLSDPGGAVNDRSPALRLSRVAI